jgi:serine/threonine-protein kinase
MAGTLTKAGRYQIVAELGRGSMGVVYKGFDPLIGRTVAIKTMLARGLGPTEFEEFKARFQREAQAAGVLAHPNIVTVYDFGEDNGVLYLAMEFLEGKSLQAMVEEQPILPIETILPIYDQVCSALDHAHARKIVHRDIKPANIMVLDNGLVKVTDFGIAKMMSAGMTQAGQILGTPNYMSPEQVKGRSVDGRADIFALGVILYELLTGEKPFGGQNITTIIYKIINENPIPPRELDATIHPGLSYVIQKALAKNPDERYQTCRELAADLRNFKNLEGAVAPSATVVVRVPPIQASAAEVPRTAPVEPPAPLPTPPPATPQALSPVEQPLPRPLSVQVIPPAPARAPRKSGAAPLLLVAFLGLGAGVGYYLYRFQQESTGVSPPATQTTSVPSPAPQPQEQGGPTGEASPLPSSETVAGTALPEEVIPPPTSGGEPTTSPVAKLPTPEAAAPAAAKPAVASKFGQLEITSNISGATITVDGKSDPAWATPFVFAELAAGTHLITVFKEGYSEFQQSVTVEAGKSKTLHAALNVPAGEISIITNPPGVEVLIDGQAVGRSPIRRSMGVGQHTYTLRQPGMDPYTSSFEIKYDGHMITKKVDFGGAAAATGVVELRTSPSGAAVQVDGNSVPGQAPMSFRVPAGLHTITLTLSGCQPLRKDVFIPANATVPLIESLTCQ